MKTNAHDKRERWNGFAECRDQVNEVDDLQDFVSKNSADLKKAYISHGNKIDHDHETHRETVESTKLLQENKFSKIMHRRVNPTPTLRKQHPPVIRSNSVRIGVPNGWLRLEPREILEERGQVTIFTEMQEILHMQGVDAVFRVVLDELVRNERGLVRVGGSQAMEGEQPGKQVTKPKRFSNALAM